MNTPKYYKYIGDRNIRTLEDAENYITKKCLNTKNGFWKFTIILKSDGSKIGFCGIYVRPSLETPDIGFAFFEEFEGKGYA
jgi:RimJ/RimL family protein N-acetyltransferase